MHPIAVTFVQKFGRHLLFLFVISESKRLDRYGLA